MRLPKPFKLQNEGLPPEYWAPHHKARRMKLIPYRDLDAESLAVVMGLLPKAAHQLIEVIGFEPAMAIVEEFGGVCILFPKSQDGKGAERFEQVASVIGVENAKLLGKNFYTVVFNVPRCTRAYNALRNRVIVRDCDELLKTGISLNKTIEELVYRYRMSYRQIEVIVHGTPLKKSKKTTTK